MRRARELTIGVAIAAAALAIVAKGVSNYASSSNFGQMTIRLPNGSQVFVVHEQWGLHSDQLYVTQDSDGCRPPDPRTDFIDRYGDGKTLIYSTAADSLILYEEERQPATIRIQEPTTKWSRAHVAVRKAPWSAMRENPDKYHVKVMKVPGNEFCWINFFRDVGTSLRDYW